MKLARKLLVQHWRLVVLTAVGCAVFCSLLLYRLGTLPGSLSFHEAQQQAFSSSWHNIVNNPLNAPLTALQWLCTTVLGHGNASLRLASTILGFLAVVLFGYILRRWYGVRTAIYGTVVFACSAWLFHVGRYADTEVLYLFTTTLLLATMIAWDRYGKQPQVIFAIAAALAVIAYVPGMIWLIVSALALQPTLVTKCWRSLHSLRLRILGLVWCLALVAPLVLALIHNRALIRTWLGLPTTIGTPQDIVHQLGHTITYFVWQGPYTPELWLDKLPILTIFTGAMAVLGIFFYAKHLAAPRTRLLAAIYLVGAALYALRGPVGLSVIVPIVYLLVAGGIGYLLHEWLCVFPRNPLARNTGFILISLLIVLNGVYSLRAYYVAWPHNSATRSVFPDAAHPVIYLIQ